ncbi:hypothetical protein D3C86_1286050 [compost metagenome]
MIVAEQALQGHQRQAAIRRAQHRQPGQPVARMRQRPHQLHEVRDHRPQGQRHQIHGAATDALLREPPGQIAQMTARAHQHRHGMLGPLVIDQRLAHQSHRDVLGLLFGRSRAFARPGRMKTHRRVRQSLVKCGGRAVGDRTRSGIAALGQQFHERTVDPLHDAGLGTKIVRQVQEIRLQFAHAYVRHFQEQTDFRLAEAVDRLHRIAHQEQAAAIAGLPAGSQRAQQVQLRLAGVLEFVDEQVADGSIQLEQQFARIIGAAQRGRGALRDLDEIHLALVGKAQAQLRHGQRQRHQLGAQHLPLRVREMRRGDIAHRMQPAHPGRLPVRAFQPGHERFLVRALGGKSQVLVDRLAQ